MLVQTTVTAVIPYFERFLGRFPDVGSLAAADESDVLKSWEGLGYYRRARQLHAAARMIVHEYGGTIPDDPAAVRALPGVGRYIAGAILSFAFDRPEPIVEANSQRVLARLLAIEENLKTASTQAAYLASGRAAGAGRRSGDIQPGAHGAGGPGLHAARAGVPGLPVCRHFARPAGWGFRTSARDDSEAAAPGRHRSLCDRRPRRQDPDRSARARGALGAILGIPHDPPRRGRPGGDDLSGKPVELAEGVKRLTGISIEPGPPVKALTYSVTNHRVKLSAYLAEARAGILKPGPGLVDARWVEPAKLGEYTFSSASRRLIAWIKQEPWHRDGRYQRAPERLAPASNDASE